MQASMRDTLFQHIDERLDFYIQKLITLVRQPSISAQGVGIGECAALVKQAMEDAGLAAQIIPTGGPPVVYGERKGGGERTLLLYNHYDVQPPDPLDLWSGAPFEPWIADGKLFGRGTADDKGGLVSRLAAIRALLDVLGELPCSVRFVVEGEEETGSRYLPRFIEAHRERLAADGCLWEAGGVDWDGRPQICLGLKGTLYVELQVQSMSVDSHSANGTHLPNAAWRLTWALSTLKDSAERILIPGFYDNVRPPTAGELAAADGMSLDEERTMNAAGIEGFLLGLTGGELRRRHLLEPIVNICGIASGYTGDGSKTVLPSTARAKIDFRLVPDQRPDDILANLRRHLDDQGFSDVQILGGDEMENPARTPLDHPFVQLVVDAALDAYGQSPAVIPTMAGSGPMHGFVHTLGLPVATAGPSYPDSRPHAPDEHIRLADFRTAIKHAAAIMVRMG